MFGLLKLLQDSFSPWAWWKQRPQPVFGYPWEMKWQISWDNIQDSLNMNTKPRPSKPLLFKGPAFVCLTSLSLLLLSLVLVARFSSGDTSSQMLPHLLTCRIWWLPPPTQSTATTGSSSSLTVPPQTFNPRDWAYALRPPFQALCSPFVFPVSSPFASGCPSVNLVVVYLWLCSKSSQDFDLMPR